MREPLKPFTSYVCPLGSGKIGHSGMYTGSYEPRLRRETDGICICGEPMIPELSMRDGLIYRLEFETINPSQAESMERERGRGVWGLLTYEEWDALSWHQVSRESDLPNLKDQAATLRRWAETHEQPIRNVSLLSAAAPTWQPAKG